MSTEMSVSRPRNFATTNILENRQYRFICGDARTDLKKLAPQMFQTCITSPPYWGLRDYGVRDQIGAEMDLDEYFTHLVDVFREVRRTLRDDGTLWLNVGDSYTSGGRALRARDKKNTAREMSYRPPTPQGLKPKDLIGVPWRLAFALQSDGWYLRSDIIWHKPNCQPESVKDRPTRAHEYLFLFSKSEQYAYDSRAIREPSDGGKGYRNRRSVWAINTRGFNGAHFAVFPTELVRICLMASSSVGDLVLDPFLGSGTVAEACVALSRKCVGIEIKPEYIRLAEQRVRSISGGLGL